MVRAFLYFRAVFVGKMEHGLISVDSGIGGPWDGASEKHFAPLVLVDGGGSFEAELS